MTALNKIIVSQKGDGDVSSISEALSIANENALIVVRSGCYRERLVLEKCVTISGEQGENGYPVLSPCFEDYDCGVDIKSDAVIENFCICGEGNENAESVGVLIEASATLNNVSVYGWCDDGMKITLSAAPQITNCNFYGNEGCGVLVENRSNPAIINCSFHENGQDGLRFEKKAFGIVKQCDFYRNNCYGTRVSDYSNPTFVECVWHDACDSSVAFSWALGTLEKCQIRTSYNNAVEISEESSTVIKECEIIDNQNGILVFSKSNPTIVDCEFRNMVRFAIRFVKSGGLVERCNILSCGRIHSAALEVCRKSNPQIKSCKIDSSDVCAVRLASGSEGVVESCEITNSGMASYVSKDKSKPNVVSSKINHSVYGVIISNSTGKMSQCDVSNCVNAGRINDKSTFELHGSCFNSNAQGIQYDASSGTVVDCKVHDSNRGIRVNSKSNVQVLNSEIAQCKVFGAVFQNESKGCVHNCAIHSMECGVGVYSKSNVSIRYNEIHGVGKQCVRFEMSKGLVDNCEIYDSDMIGISVREGAEPKIENCHFYNVKNQSLFVKDSGVTHIDNCRIGPGGRALMADGKSQLILSNSQISQCGNESHYAVKFQSGASGILENCSIHDCPLGGVIATLGSVASVKKCRVYNNDIGVIGSDKASIQILNSEFFGNAKPAIKSILGAVLLVKDCSIHDNQLTGVYLTKKGGVQVENCKFLSNGGGSVYATKNSDAIIKDSQVSDTMANGFVFNNSVGEVSGCELSHCGHAAIAVVEKSNVLICDCNIHDNEMAGVKTRADGVATVKDCRFENNKLGDMERV